MWGGSGFLSGFCEGVQVVLRFFQQDTQVRRGESAIFQQDTQVPGKICAWCGCGRGDISARTGGEGMGLGGDCGKHGFPPEIHVWYYTKRFANVKVIIYLTNPNA
jgi:hypothetical protein